MSNIKTQATWLGIDVNLGEREFHFTFKEAKAMHGVLDEALRRLGVKKSDQENGRTDKSGNTLVVLKELLTGLVWLGYIEEKHYKRIFEDFKDALGECENE